MDPKRVNEFGTSGEDHQTQSPSQGVETEDLETLSLQSNSLSPEGDGSVVSVGKGSSDKKND